jgi:hypothetical protein
MAGDWAAMTSPWTRSAGRGRPAPRRRVRRRTSRQGAQQHPPLGQGPAVRQEPPHLARLPHQRLARPELVVEIEVSVPMAPCFIQWIGPDPTDPLDAA